MPDWFRPVCSPADQAVKQPSVCLKHGVNEASRKDGINRLPMEHKLSTCFKHLMVQPHLGRLTYTVDRFSPGGWIRTGRILNKQASEHNWHNSLKTLSLQLAQF